MRIETKNGLHYLEIGYHSKKKPSYVLHIEPSLVGPAETIEFPVVNARIVEREALILETAEGWNTFDIFVPAGYGGGSGFEVITDAELFPYWTERSDHASCDLSSGALVCTIEKRLAYRWWRVGPHTGAPQSGITILSIDGAREDYYSDGGLVECPACKMASVERGAIGSGYWVRLMPLSARFVRENCELCHGSGEISFPTFIRHMGLGGGISIQN